MVLATFIFKSVGRHVARLHRSYVNIKNKRQNENLPDTIEEA